MTSSKNPVREFIEILQRIRTGHENLKVSSGIPGFIPGTGERVDAFSTALPWESATPDGLFTLKGDKPGKPRGTRLCDRDLSADGRHVRDGEDTHRPRGSA